MITFNDITSGFEYIPSSFFVFKSQNEVVYYLPETKLSIRLTRSDLIVSINHFISRIEYLGFESKLNKDYDFNHYKYYELSVYLHGLILLYQSIIKDVRVGDLSITRSSRLPHDVIMSDNRPVLEIDCAYLPVICSDIKCFVALLSGSHPICRTSFYELREKLQSFYPMHRVILKVVGS